MNVQGDEPMIEPGVIDQAISAAQVGDAEIVTLDDTAGSDPGRADPNRVKVVVGSEWACAVFFPFKNSIGRDLFSPSGFVRLPRSISEDCLRNSTRRRWRWPNGSNN